jgi:hypothetical protein
MLLRALIALRFGSGNRKPLDLSAGDLLELRLPALSGLDDEEQHQTVTDFAAVYAARILHTTRRIRG